MFKTLAVILLSMTALADAPADFRPEVRSVRFVSNQLTVSRRDSSAYVRGPVRVDMTFPGGVAKRPVLRIFCLCDVDGELICRSGVWGRPKTYSAMSRGEIGDVFKRAGVELKGPERNAAYSDMARISRCQAECSKSVFANVVYGEKDLYRGFFRFGGVKENVRIVAYRLELWQNGALAGSYVSPRSAASGYDLPVDWYDSAKHSERFRFEDNP